MNRKGQTTHYKLSDYIGEISQFLGDDVFDYVIVNEQMPSKDLIDVYAEEGQLVENDLDEKRVIRAQLLGELLEKPKKDLIKRNLIRHDPKKLAEELIRIVNHI